MVTVTPDVEMSILPTIGLGILASILALLGDRAWTAVARWRTFKRLAGTYDHFDRRAQTPVKDASGCPRTSVLTYKGTSHFEVATATDKGAWYGEIIMDPHLSRFGKGFFEYTKTPPRQGTWKYVNSQTATST
jgi:hypothetical protein